MKVAILCGGLGTRLRDISEVLPKPMVPIGQKPILWHIMKIYSSFGFDDFVLLLGYKGHFIREFFLNFSAYTTDATIDLNKTDKDRLIIHRDESEPWKVTMVDTGEHSMTGARLWRARKYLEDAPMFLATYGDGVGNIDVQSLLQFHRQHGKVATLTGVRPPGRFGELKVEGKTVKKFNEKPQVSGGYINGGFFAFNSSIFDKYLEARENLVLEKEPMEKLTKEGQLMMYPHDDFWQPVDTPREHQLLNELWNSGKAPWKIWSDEKKPANVVAMRRDR